MLCISSVNVKSWLRLSIRNAMIRFSMACWKLVANMVLNLPNTGINPCKGCDGEPRHEGLVGFQHQNDRGIKARRLDIALVDKKKPETFTIDIIISSLFIFIILLSDQVSMQAYTSKLPFSNFFPSVWIKNRVKLPSLQYQY